MRRLLQSASSGIEHEVILSLSHSVRRSSIFERSGDERISMRHARENHHHLFHCPATAATFQDLLRCVNLCIRNCVKMRPLPDGARRRDSRNSLPTNLHSSVYSTSFVGRRKRSEANAFVAFLFQMMRDNRLIPFFKFQLCILLMLLF